MITPTGKYARIENERRFLLRPGDEELLTWDLPRRIINNNYIIDTNLRLREVDNEGEKVYKLTKKTTLSPEERRSQPSTCHLKNTRC